MQFPIGIVLALAIVAGCGMSPPVATANDAIRVNVELAALQHGRTVLLSKCGGCHRPPLPTDVKVGEWPHELDEMGGRAKLDDAQRRLLEQYLIAMAVR